MKKILATLIFSQMLILFGFAQTRNSDVQNLKQLNQELVEKYKAGKFEDALIIGRQILDLSIKVYGADNIETGVSYANLGEVYHARNKNADAAENLQKALAIYRKNPTQSRNKIPKVLESLGVVLALDGKTEQAESFFTQNVADTETLFGKESKEVIPTLKALTDFYIYAKRYDKVDEGFTNRYLLTRKLYGKESDDLDEIRDEHYCFLNKTFGYKKAGEKQKDYEDALDKIINPDRKDDKITPKKINGGVVNGKALSLPKPNYPLEARQARASGSVMVKVLIDETGKVYETKAFCGDPLLRKSSEEAAANSKFKPTTLEGSPVKVSGVIIYNYVL